MARISSFEEFRVDRVDESLKDWIIAGALAATSLKSRGQDVTRPEVVRQTKTRMVDDSIKVDFGSEFQSGRYKFATDSAESMKSKLSRIAEFLVRHQKQNIIIRIDGSESKVPNYDAETGKPLPDKALAKLRVEETRGIIQGMLDKMDRSGMHVGFDTTVRIGGPEYEKGDSPRDQKFTDHQYVRVTVSARGAEETQTELRLCGYRRDFGGGYGDPSDGFKVASTSQVLDMGTGTGKMGFKFDPVMVPDIFIVEYNGKVHMTGLIGSDLPYYRMAYATIIGNYYRGKQMPDWFKGLRFKEISVEEATRIARASSASDVGDFAHVFGRKASFEELFADKTIRPMILDRGQIGEYDENAPSWAESNWGIVIDKVKGADKVRVTAVGVIGQTRWSLQIDCIGCK